MKQSVKATLVYQIIWIVYTLQVVTRKVHMKWMTYQTTYMYKVSQKLDLSNAELSETHGVQFKRSLFIEMSKTEIDVDKHGFSQMKSSFHQGPWFHGAFSTWFLVAPSTDLSIMNIKHHLSSREQAGWQR